MSNEKADHFNYLLHWSLRTPCQQIDTISVNSPSMGKDIKNVVILWTQLKLSEKYSTH